MDEEIQSLRERFIEAAGNTTQSFGAGRVLGQMFAHLYFSKDPQSLDELTAGLGISKGSASMAARQLEQWGALRRVWLKGDRKDYFEATDEFGKIIRRALLEAIGQRMETADGLLKDAESLLEARRKKTEPLDGEWAFLESRLRRFRVFRDRAQWLWDKFISSMLLS